MKKIIICIIIFILLFNTSKKDDYIRVRILANSNSKEDLQLKSEVSDIVSTNLYNLLKNETDIDKARDKIKNNITNLSNEINKIDMDYDFDIDYGYHHFPEKEYNGETYEEGEYESLLITLGSGEGSNWWCILFPPVCLVEATETNNEEVEYTFFLEELFHKLFK